MNIGGFNINHSSIGKVSSLNRDELLELHFKKDRYIDFLHGKICELNNQLYSTRKYRQENLTIIENQNELIDCLKLRLFNLTGSIME